MLASVCRRRRLLFALRQISVGGDGGARTRVHPIPSTILLSHLSSLTAAAPNSNPCPATVSYLVSCGVSASTAAVKKLRIRDTDKADAVRDLLREYGFSDAEVTRTVCKDPKLLTFDPDQILRPKLDFLLVSLGFKPRVIASEPHILARSLDKHLVPCVDFLRGILGTDDKLCVAITRRPRALMADIDSTMRPALEAFCRHGLSEESFSKLVFISPGVLMMRMDRINGAFGDLKDIGISVTDRGFIYAFRVMCWLSRETWQRKVALFVSLGVSKDVVIRAFKRHPTLLAVSEEAIRKKSMFYLDVLKLELNSIMQQPLVLMRSLEKCVKPRCSVLSLLIRGGKLERKPNLISALTSSREAFSKRFVLKYANEVPDIVKAFEGKIKFDGFGDQELEFFSILSH